MKLSLLAPALLVGFTSFSQDLENIGPMINTKNYTECYPELTPDGQTLFFSRDNAEGDMGGYDIYFSEKDQDGNWKKAQPLKKANNSKKNVVYHVSADGNTLVLLGQYGEKPTEHGFSYVRRTSIGWSDPEPLKFEREDEIKWGNNALTMSSNERIMIISLKGDLHVSFLNDEGVWSFPKSIGDVVNTGSNEYSPFLGSDNVTLYFSSGGHGGLGGNDIFKVKRTDDSWLNWTEPENLGKPINSSSWESFFRLYARGDKAFVYSLSEGDGDIFQVDVSEKLRPNPVALACGTIVDEKTKEPVQNASITYYDVKTGEPIGLAYAHPTLGTFDIVLNEKRWYGFLVTGDDHLSYSTTISIGSLGSYKELQMPVSLPALKKGAKIELNNISFASGKSTLKPESHFELNMIAQMMNQQKSMQVEIGGYTDKTGSKSKNIKLSKERAEAVKSFLMSQGISGDRIVTKGYGPAKPIASNKTAEGRVQNRRVEFKILAH